MLTTHWHRPFDQADCYFVVGNRKTYSRTKAIEWANGNMELIKLYWMDEVWSNMDLTRPPDSSWNDLMRTRCCQVRSKASIFGIAFSGGYDSQTILDHCIMNNILVDDIQINHKSFDLHPEFKSAVNTANLIKQHHYPKLNISTIDIDVNYLLNIYRAGGNNWMENESLSELKFTKQSRSSLINFNSGHTKTLDLVNRVVVEGHEKPRLFIHDGWWVMAMHDGVFDHTFNTPFENFYISRELPELHLKQIWMMIDWMESQPYDTLSKLEEFLHFVQKNLDNNVNEQWNLAVGRNRVRHVNSWDLDLMHKHSARGGIYSFDTVSLLTRHPYIRELLQVNTWENAVIEFIKKYPGTYVSPEDVEQFSSTRNINAGTQRHPINVGLAKNIWTRRYPIKPVEPGKNNSSVLAGKSPNLLHN
jgi:hypothetical protein